MHGPIPFIRQTMMDWTIIWLFVIRRRFHIPSVYRYLKITFTGPTGVQIQLYELTNGMVPILRSLIGHHRNHLEYKFFIRVDSHHMMESIRVEMGMAAVHIYAY